MRSSERPSDKITPLHRMREPVNQSGVKQPKRLAKRTYCIECGHRKRGNTWDLDYCRKFKKLCTAARKQLGTRAIMDCKGFGVIEKIEEN